MTNNQLKDKITRRLVSTEIFSFIGDYLRSCLVSDKIYIVTVEEETSGKTMAQLRGIFGRFANEVSERTGETVDDIIREWKGHFLVDIYRTDPRAGAQSDWLDVLSALEEAQQWDVITKYRKTISLSWASVKQAKEFMHRIENHYISIGEPLEPIDPHWRQK